MQVGDLVRYITTNDIGIIIDKEYECYRTTDDYAIKIYWLDGIDPEGDWYNEEDLEVINESR